MNWLIFIISQNWIILHNKFPQKILWAMFLIEECRREGEGTDGSMIQTIKYFWVGCCTLGTATL